MYLFSKISPNLNVIGDKKVTDVYWPPAELIRSWSRTVDFFILLVFPNQWNRSQFWFPGMFRRTLNCRTDYILVTTCWSLYFLWYFQINETGQVCMYPVMIRRIWGMKMDLLIFPAHLQFDWFFLILVTFCLGEAGQLWGFLVFSKECMEGISWYLACSFILTTARNN